MNTLIGYPPGVITDQEKLFALYNLMEQFRVVHNGFGEQASGDWEKYGEKFRGFQRTFNVLQSPVRSGILVLRRNIRVAQFTDQEWRGLPLYSKETYDIRNNLFGDKDYWRKITKQFTFEPLEHLKKLKLDKQIEIPDPLENWLTFTEVDTGGYLTVAANQIVITAMVRNCDSKVYKSYGAGHFNNFTHFVDGTLDIGTDWSNIIVLWSVSNALPVVDPWEILYLQSSGATNYQCFIYNGETGGSDNSPNVAKSTIRYFTVDRNPVDVDCMIYTDAIRTTLWDTLTITRGVATFEYMSHAYPQANGSGAPVTGDVYNLDLNEGGAVVGSGGGVVTNMASKMLGF